MSTSDIIQLLALAFAIIAIALAADAIRLTGWETKP